MSDFSAYPLAHGLVEDLRLDEFPTVLSAWRGGKLSVEHPGTHFGFVSQGAAVLRCSSGTFELRPGMYFAVPGELTIEHGQGMIASRIGYRGFFQLGGPIEVQGRLRYIDGCTDSLLIAPVMRGDPCLNLLAFPPQTRQTEHTHPSLRAGIIVRGRGTCLTPDWECELAPGQLFVIRPGCMHNFCTESSGLLVIAYHPDSDFGPTHEDHPMINRTMIVER